MGEQIEKKRMGVNTLIEGNFNTRTGREREAAKVKKKRSGGGKSKKSRDKKVNRDKKKLVEFVKKTD